MQLASDESIRQAFEAASDIGYYGDDFELFGLGWRACEAAKTSMALVGLVDRRGDGMKAHWNQPVPDLQHGTALFIRSPQPTEQEE